MKLDDYKQAVSILEFIKFRNDLDIIIKRDGKNALLIFPIRDLEGKIQYQNRQLLKSNKLVLARLNKENGSNYEVYFDMYNFDKSKPKTIIDFISTYVLKEDKVDFKKVTGVLKQYMQSPGFIPLDNSSFDLPLQNTTEQKQITSKTFVFDLPTKHTFNYLKSRKISQDTYMSSKFIGTYGSYTDDKKGINKPAFILTKNDKKKQTLQWIDWDENSFKHRGKYFLDGLARNSALHRSTFSVNNNIICLTEGPEKSMAHYQLYKKDMQLASLDPIYLSSCGVITLNDIQEIKSFSKEKEISKYLLAFDNDISGQIYTLNVLLNLNCIGGSVTLTDNKVYYTGPDQQANEFYNKLHYGMDFYDHNRKLEIKNLSKAIEVFTPSNVIIHKSITKDFVDDLKDDKKLPFHFTKEQKTKRRL